ncbi:MAG: DoxX family protein [Balneolaceae bacterium]|nr:DoxX family protein [Balneolaceae bacterium]
METGNLSKLSRIASWTFQLLAAIILLQTLYFKFTGAEESIYIFETVGMEPWGRYGSGVVELIAGILLVIPRRAWMGALLGIGVISGAILFHITTLGIEVMNDGGALFYLAVTVFVSCLLVLIIQREQMISDIKRWLK